MQKIVYQALSGNGNTGMWLLLACLNALSKIFRERIMFGYVKRTPTTEAVIKR